MKIDFGDEQLLQPEQTNEFGVMLPLLENVAPFPFEYSFSTKKCRTTYENYKSACLRWASLNNIPYSTGEIVQGIGATWGYNGWVWFRTLGVNFDTSKTLNWIQPDENKDVMYVVWDLTPKFRVNLERILRNRKEIKWLESCLQAVVAG